MKYACVCIQYGNIMCFPTLLQVKFPAMSHIISKEINIMKLVASGMKLRAEVSILHFYKLKCTIT